MVVDIKIATCPWQNGLGAVQSSRETNAPHESTHEQHLDTFEARIAVVYGSPFTQSQHTVVLLSQHDLRVKYSDLKRLWVHSLVPA